MVESIPVLEWKRKRGTLIREAKLPDGTLSIRPVASGHDLWFHGKGEWGTNNYIGSYPTLEAALLGAAEWTGNSEPE